MDAMKLRTQMTNLELAASAASTDVTRRSARQRVLRFKRPWNTTGEQERFLFGATRAEICAREESIEIAAREASQAAREALRIGSTL